MKVWALLLAVFAVGCVDPTPPWQLDHDRIIAVRATPPTATAGGRIDLDVLVTTEGGDGPQLIDPLAAQAVPGGFEAAVVHDDQGWAVIAPDAETIAAAREAMGLMPGAPVPFQVGLGMQVGASELAAIKTVFFNDEERPNPELGPVTIGGQDAVDDMTVPLNEEIEMVIEVTDEAVEKVDWLASVGELRDADDPVGHLQATEAVDGYIAVVRRDGFGGVAWGYWAVSAQ